MGVTLTSENAAQAIMKLVATEALEALVGSLVMGNLVNRQYEASLAQSGDTITVPIPSPLVANNIAETGTVQLQNPSLGSAQIVLNQHIESTFALSNVMQALATPSIIDIYLKEAIIALGESIETSLLATYPLFTYNSTLGGNTALTEATVDTAETVLWANKVPPSQQRYLVVAGTPYGSLRQISAFRDYTGIGPNVGTPAPAMSGKLAGKADGEVKGFQVYRSQYVTKATENFNMAFTKDAIGMVMRKLELPTPGTGAIGAYAEIGNFGLRVLNTYQGSTLGQTFTVDALYGIAPFRQQFMQVIESN